MTELYLEFIIDFFGILGIDCYGLIVWVRDEVLILRMSAGSSGPSSGFSGGFSRAMRGLVGSGYFMVRGIIAEK